MPVSSLFVILCNIMKEAVYNRIAFQFYWGEFRLPSIKSKILKETLKTVSPLISNADIEIQRRQLDFLSTFKRPTEDLNVIPLDLGMIRAEWIVAQGSPRSPIVLYFHGGAYVSGSLLSGRVLAGEIAHTLKYKVLSFEYRLAPEHPYPAALADALSAYNHLLESGFEPQDILFAGESAGGGLCLVTALTLKQYGRAMPAALACLSPWADLTCSGYSHEKNKHKDPLLNTESLKHSALQYAGEESLTCPLISPAFGDFDGFPPTLIQVGMDEILYCDAETLHKKMLGANVDVALSAYEGMWHVWQIYEIPEARKALNEIGEFIKTQTKKIKSAACF